VHLLNRRCSMQFPEFEQNGYRAAKSCCTYSNHRIPSLPSLRKNH
jgi:hypothetical protein